MFTGNLLWKDSEKCGRWITRWPSQAKMWLVDGWM